MIQNKESDWGFTMKGLSLNTLCPRHIMSDSRTQGSVCSCYYNWLRPQRSTWDGTREREQRAASGEVVSPCPQQDLRLVSMAHRVHCSTKKIFCQPLMARKLSSGSPPYGQVAGVGIWDGLRFTVPQVLQSCNRVGKRDWALHLRPPLNINHRISKVGKDLFTLGHLPSHRSPLWTTANPNFKIALFLKTVCLVTVFFFNVLCHLVVILYFFH
jgi:hypothetical protein